MKSRKYQFRCRPEVDWKLAAWLDGIPPGELSARIRQALREWLQGQGSLGPALPEGGECGGAEELVGNPEGSKSDTEGVTKRLDRLCSTDDF